MEGTAPASMAPKRADQILAVRQDDDNHFSGLCARFLQNSSKCQGPIQEASIGDREGRQTAIQQIDAHLIGHLPVGIQQDAGKCILRGEYRQGGLRRCRHQVVTAVPGSAKPIAQGCRTCPR